MRNIDIHLVGKGYDASVTLGIFAAMFTQIIVLFDEIVDLLPDLFLRAGITGCRYNIDVGHFSRNEDQVVHALSVAIDITVVGIGETERTITLVNNTEVRGCVFAPVGRIGNLQQQTVVERCGRESDLFGIGVDGRTIFPSRRGY